MTKVTIWGCRGSLAAPGEKFTKYGGNTSCVEITSKDGTSLILDAGTGILGLGRERVNGHQKHNLLLTHLHMDHLQGMGFFSPFFDRKSEVNIWGPASTTLSLRARLTRYLSPPLFPVSIRDLPCKLVLHEVPKKPFTVGPFKITTDLIGHVGPTVGYRIKIDQAVITYIPDHEPALGVEDFPLDQRWTSGYALAKNADLLLHDAQFSDQEYQCCIGWGHSSINDAFKFASLTGVKHLVPFHHDPNRTDEELSRMVEETIQSQKPDFKVTTAREGAVFEF